MSPRGHLIPSSIVRVHDVGRTDDGSIDVVSKFIEGRTLGEAITEDRPDHDESAKQLALACYADCGSVCPNFPIVFRCWRRSRCCGEAKGNKVVIVLDQFEQWLHAHRSERDAELVNALRRCDGGRLQVVVMVRDDFAMAAARFMDSLDIPIVQGHNFATVDLFDTDQARKVLIRFGQASGNCPPKQVS